ncbi:GNAT family N-acetyltransferase [Streptomyces sp. NPDC002994]|uniref:GNAT family N-acetyltransferase n=1 Tax=Streptomyces sp. NPDC002994 TaxID=3154441 RepID=UPI0033BB3D22
MVTTAPEPALRFTELGGFGLRLRTWDEDDADTALRGLNDPEFQHWNGAMADVLDPAGVLKYIRSRAEGWENGSQASYCIADAATGAVLGHVGLHEIVYRMGHAGVGYWLMPEARGRGVATHAVELCTRWAFEEVGLHRLELGHALGNEASCRVALRTGYQPEGISRGGLPAKEPGTYFDMHVHARLATDPAPAVA